MIQARECDYKRCLCRSTTCPCTIMFFFKNPHTSELPKKVVPQTLCQIERHNTCQSLVIYGKDTIIQKSAFKGLQVLNVEYFFSNTGFQCIRYTTCLPQVQTANHVTQKTFILHYRLSTVLQLFCTTLFFLQIISNQ